VAFEAYTADVLFYLSFGYRIAFYQIQCLDCNIGTSAGDVPPGITTLA
jgi:hypothetical protein